MKGIFRRMKSDGMYEYLVPSRGQNATTPNFNRARILASTESIIEYARRKQA